MHGKISSTLENGLSVGGDRGSVGDKVMGGGEGGGVQLCHCHVHGAPIKTKSL